jgi:hypothetical protein
MLALRIVLVLVSVVGAGLVLISVLRTVVLPRAVPARLARLVFIGVRLVLQLRLRLGGKQDYRTRDRVFALQAPLGLFAQLAAWGTLIFLSFALLFWAISPGNLTGTSALHAITQAGSSMLTLGFDAPSGLGRQLTAFIAAAVGLTLFALVITYLPSLYGSFQRREAQITKLAVRAGAPPAGPSLLARTWQLDRFEQLEEVWNAWEDWFIDLGESHTTFPQLGFFRSPHPRNHWVTAGEAVLDAAALFMTGCDVPRQSRAELCLDAGVYALVSIADFLGIPHAPPEAGAEIQLSRGRFDAALDQLAEMGVPVHEDRQHAWHAFRDLRARYEPLIAVLGRMTDAPRSDWSAWSDDAPRHSPPLLRIHRR